MQLITHAVIILILVIKVLYIFVKLLEMEISFVILDKKTAKIVYFKKEKRAYLF